MAGIYTLNAQDQSLDTLRIHWQFALARLKSDPNAAAYVADFTAFGAQWAATDQKEHDLDDAVTVAETAVIAADAAIDKLVDSVSAAINGGKKPNPQLPLQQLFFGSQTPSNFKKPILGTQLEKVQKWPALLAQASQPALQALAGAMTTAVQGGNTAAKALDDTLAARSAFRLGGDRQKAFDTFNSISAKAYGGLKAFAHDHPELGLPSNYAESFFKGSARSPHGQTVIKTAKVASKAAAKAAKAQAAHDAALQKAAAKEAAAKDRQARKDAAKAAKKAASDAQKKAADAVAAAKKK